MCLTTPSALQGRVFAVRNSFQFLTIPLGYFLGGLPVDRVFDPVMARRTQTACWQAASAPGRAAAPPSFSLCCG